jgi:hypothetical protein
MDVKTSRITLLHNTKDDLLQPDFKNMRQM